ncbi:hypothetical protein WK78_26605 [Burkholderia cepacia]|nr:hypothetical protein WK78_26605 [Burkholderia cepacia]
MLSRDDKALFETHALFEEKQIFHDEGIELTAFASDLLISIVQAVIRVKVLRQFWDSKFAFVFIEVLWHFVSKSRHIQSFTI